MMTIDELLTKWNSISPYSEGFYLISGDHPLSFHIGYFGEQKCFMILNTGKFDTITSSKAISVNCVELEDGSYSLRFVLNYISLDELFIKLCWDLINSSYNSSQPIPYILSRFDMWIRLLQRKGEGLLPDAIRKGLAGELLYIKDLLLDKKETEIVLNSWVGPEGADQDFLFINTWSEIKAVSISATAVSISSLQQLEQQSVGSLIVYFMDKTSSQGINTFSLPQLIDEIKELISESKLIDLFLCKLAMYGYCASDNDKYSEMRYNYIEKREYKVDESFPKLIRKNVPTGINSAIYQIDLSVIEQFRI